MRAVLWILLLASVAHADAPVLSYVFPAGGQRGTRVKVRLGGLNLHDRCSWEIAGLETSASLVRQPTQWFEGAVLPLPDSQRIEDYPQDMAGEVNLSRDLPTGSHKVRVWTSQGAAGGISFVVGDLPEVVEDEIPGDPVPVVVTLPVTVNGRIFPRDDLDIWAVPARKGQVVTARVQAASLGSPLDARLEVLDATGTVLAENDDYQGPDSLVSFIAPADGVYRVRISDASRAGSQRHVYRLTLTHDPHVTSVYPAGGKKGERLRVVRTGVGVSTAPVAVTVGAPGNPLAFDVDDLPEVREEESKTVPAVPVIINGRISKPGEVDTWIIRGEKGKALTFEFRANSPLRGTLEVHGNAGVLLPRSTLRETTWTPPADGEYTVRISDLSRSRGGPSFVYRLRIREAQPDFRLEPETDALTLLRGQAKKGQFKVQVTRTGGHKGPIELSADGLPAGVTITPVRIDGTGPVTFSVTAVDSTPIGPIRVRLRGKAGAIEHVGEPILLGVALATPFKVVGTYDLRNVPRGSIYRKKYRIERNGFAGPLTVRLADRQARHLQGVTGPELTIPPGVSEFEYPVTLPPWMEIGRTSRACVMAIGQVREGGVDHTVSFSSQAQNDQIIAVVETGRLGLELGRSSLAIVSRGRVFLPVTVRRSKDLVGPVRVEVVLPEHVRGIKAEPITLARESSTGTLTLSFSDKVGPITGPVVIRARLTTGEGEASAEAPVELVPE